MQNSPVRGIVYLLYVSYQQTLLKQQMFYGKNCHKFSIFVTLFVDSYLRTSILPILPYIPYPSLPCHPAPPLPQGCKQETKKLSYR